MSDVESPSTVSPIDEIQSRVAEALSPLILAIETDEQRDVAGVAVDALADIFRSPKRFADYRLLISEQQLRTE